MPDKPAGSPGHIYISYSRRDEVFVRRLHAALTKRGRDVWIDWEDIPPSAAWRDTVQRAIEAAHAVVLVISPDWLAAPQCASELETAERSGKRIIPLLSREVDTATVPEPVARLNWILAYEGNDFDRAVDQLTEALDTDVEWIKMHTRLLQRAVEWEGNGRDKGLLLRGRPLDEAAQWLQAAEGQDRHPRPTPAQVDYIVAGLRANRRRRLADALMGSRAKAPPAPVSLRRARFDVSPRMIADTPSADDVLGFAPLVAGLDALINDEKTTLPLALAVTAPWGAGKSSLMLQLRRRLEVPPPGLRRTRRWFTVKFDAWKYEKSERMWAALAKAIYDQTQARMSRRERLQFRVRLERTRQGGIRYAAKVIAPLVAAVGLGAVALLPMVSTTAGASVAVGGLAAALTVAAHIWGVVGDPFKRAIDHYVSRPRYEEQLGFTADAEREIASLTKSLGCDEGAAGDSALAIFVDDLDRCSSRHVVEVVEAINQIFNSAEGRRCVFVLGMDRDVVAASIDVAYRDTLDFLATRGSSLGTSFGSQFLAKIVQLSVAIPEPDELAMSQLFAQITGNRALDGDLGNGAPPSPPREDVARFSALIGDQHPVNPVDVEDAAASISETLDDEAERRALYEAQRLQRAMLFTTDSEDVAAAEFEVLRRLGRNPRQIKRFDNAFRLQLHVANGTPGCALDFSRDQLVALGKWVALRLLRSDLAADLDAEPPLAAALEAHINGRVNGDEDTRARRQRYDRWFTDLEVARVLADEHEQRGVASLPLGTFLRVI